MTKYLLNRILRSLLSVIIVVGVIMTMIYVFMDRKSIFADDSVFSKRRLNQKEIYMMGQWEKYGYLDYVPFSEFLQSKVDAGELTSDEAKTTLDLGNPADGSKDNELTAKYAKEFEEYYESQGYKVVRLPAHLKHNSETARKEGGDPQLFAHKDIPILTRLYNYFSGLITIDNIHNAEGDVGERGLTFTWYDPAYGGEKFSPAIMGNGTTHKYLLYCSDEFPFIHQNLVTLNLGKSYSVNQGVEVFETMTQTQGDLKKSTVFYPSGVIEETADNIHSATYQAGTRENGELNKLYYVDDYTVVTTMKDGMSKMGYSFVIGIFAVILSYLLALPLGILMALKKDKFVDKLGTFYIVFVTAVPSLAYIFMFQSIGKEIGLPYSFDMINPTWQMYVLPIISLALPSVANLMKWLRRYMIDQMNSDYVKFARSGGMSEGQIFTKHILKNAIIPIVHGIPGSVLGALVGAIITERVYMVPGAGNLLTNAITAYDNGVIVGVALFYAVLTVTSIILGDVLMSVMDPRISFTSKAR